MAITTVNVEIKKTQKVISHHKSVSRKVSLNAWQLIDAPTTTTFPHQLMQTLTTECFRHLKVLLKYVSSTIFKRRLRVTAIATTETSGNGQVTLDNM